MALSKHIQNEIESIRPVQGDDNARWRQYADEVDRLSPTVVKEALDALHKAVAARLRL